MEELAKPRRGRPTKGAARKSGKQRTQEYRARRKKVVDEEAIERTRCQMILKLKEMQRVFIEQKISEYYRDWIAGVIKDVRDSNQNSDSASRGINVDQRNHEIIGEMTRYADKLIGNKNRRVRNLTLNIHITLSVPIRY